MPHSPDTESLALGDFALAALTSRAAGEPVDAAEAEEFLRLRHHEDPAAGDLDRRLRWVRGEIAATGTYQHTTAELTFGARLAWRNAARCIGRLYWRSLRVRDLRATHTAAQVAEHCRTHLRMAANGGKVRPLISVFPAERPGEPAPRIWNEQLVRYAGYRLRDGGVRGDPRYAGFTEAATELGWRPPKRRGSFDPLPLIVETQHEGPQVFDLHAEDVLEVPLRHPEYPWFGKLGWRWHAVPAISNMVLRIGGVNYPCAPFNGWYMGTEIGARNLIDPDRYDFAPRIGDLLGLDRSSETTLWRDRAVIEVNRAVLHSFAADGVTIADHHTESRRFLTHVAREEAAGRTCPTDWSWIVPPISGGLTPVFHRYYDTEPAPGPQFLLDQQAVARGRNGRPRCFADQPTQQLHLPGLHLSS